MPPRTGNIIYSESFANRRIEIIDDETHRSLYFAEGVLQSRMSLTAPHELLLFYTQYMMSALLVQPAPSRVLLIGIGGGALIRFVHHHFPICAIDAVDNLPRIIPMAVGYFRTPDKAPVALHCKDGLDFLATRNGLPRYDLILVDAFDEGGMAKTIYGREFFALCLQSLQPGGILSCNLWSGDSGELEAVKGALADLFPGQLYLPVPQRGNVVALAFTTPVPWKEIDRPPAEIAALSTRFHLDFKKMVVIAKKQNLNLGRRINNLFARS